MAFVIKNSKGEYWTGKVIMTFKNPAWELVCSEDESLARTFDDLSEVKERLNRIDE